MLTLLRLINFSSAAIHLSVAAAFYTHTNFVKQASIVIEIVLYHSVVNQNTELNLELNLYQEIKC